MKDHFFVRRPNGDIGCCWCRVALSGCTERDLNMLNEEGRNSCYGGPKAYRDAMMKASYREAHTVERRE